MFDKEFNPLGRLEDLEIKFTKQVEFNNKLVDALNQQSEFLNKLHERIRLLEMVRQYENKK